MKSLFDRWRERRLASVYVLLATLTVVIVAGSYAAHGVRGQAQQNASSDAAPLKIVNQPTTPNDFTRIAHTVGPAVVNINTQTLPKQSDNNRNRQFRGRQMQPQNPGDDDDQNGQGGQGEDNFQDF